MPRSFYFILLLLTRCATAQNALNYSGARSWGMGNALVAVPQPQSFFQNPAGMAFQEGVSIASTYDSRFDMAGLGTASLMAVYATKKLALGIGGERFGDQLYNENKFGVAVAKSTGRVALGVKASYLGSMAGEFSSMGTIYSEFGVMARLSSLLTVGMLAQNLTGARWYGADPLPTTLHVGGSVSPIPQILWSAEVGYMVNGKASFRSGLEYALREQLYLRAGVNTGLRSNHFGVGYMYKPWTLDYAVHTHPNLGLSHHISLQFQPKAKS